MYELDGLIVGRLEISGLRAVGDRVFVVGFRVGCLDLDPTGEGVDADGAFDGRTIVGDLDGLLWFSVGDAEGVS